MSIASRIEAIEQHLTDDYNVLEVAGADLTNVDKNILNLKLTWQERLLYFMNNGTQEVWDNWEKVVGEGTTITLNNTEEAPMSLVYKGNTYQDSTTGKQLFDISKVISSNNVINNNNGTLTITATSSSTSVPGRTPNTLKDYCPNLQVGDIVYLNAITTATGTNNRIYLLGSNESWYFGNSRTITQNDLNSIVYWYANGLSTTATISNIMVSTTGGEYEPYTNGASPNPDYPQDIHVVSGDNSIEVCGKNLAYTGWAGNFVTRINNSNYATLETFDNRNCLKWKEVAGYGDYDNKYMFKINWKENTQYTFSFDLYTTSTNNFGNICIEYTDGTITEINGAYNQWTHKIQTSTSGKTIKYLRPNWRIGYSYIDLDTFMVYEGTTALPYEPYTGESYPISLGNIELCKIGTYQDKIDKSSGKNLFDKDNTVVGWLRNTGTINPEAGSHTSDYIIIEPSSNYIRTTSEGNCYYDENKTFISYYYGKNIATPNNAKYLRMTVNDNYINNEQLEKGTTALEYEPYGTSWYVKKEIGKVVLDGTQGTISMPSTNRFNIDNAFSDFLKNTGITSYLCDNYQAFEQKGNNADFNALVSSVSYGMDLSSSTSYTIRFKDTRYTSIADFQSWLSTHNTTLYYVLATPTYTEITDSTLLSQLNALAKSYNSQTNISQENNDLASILNATALREMA